MSYVRLLRLPPQSGDVGFSCWRRHLSARSGSGSIRVEHGRDASNAWQHRHLRASNYVLSKAGNNGMLDAAAESVVGKSCHEEVGIPLKCVVGGGSGNGETIIIGRSATRPTSAALTAIGGLQIDPAHRVGLLPRSTRWRKSLAFRGALGIGWDHGVGGTGLQWQSLRAFASTPPEPASKTDSPTSKAAAQSGPRPRAFLGDLLKPSDVSGTAALAAVVAQQYCCCVPYDMTWACSTTDRVLWLRCCAFCFAYTAVRSTQEFLYGSCAPGRWALALSYTPGYYVYSGILLLLFAVV